MKKLFTLLMVLAVASVGYAQVKHVSMKDAKMKPAKMQMAPRTEGMETMQNVLAEPNMLREDGELDYSFYDWQSNDGARTWTHIWPDGKVNFAFTIASDATFSDRGTAIGTYDSANDEWIPSGGRIENEKTGFGSIAQYGANGIVVAAHTATECPIFIIPDKDNYTPGTIGRAGTLNNDNEPTWPNVMTSGANRDIIHVVALGYSDNVIYYFRSQDGGATWDKENVVLPYMTPEYSMDFNSNCCYWMETTEDNCLALVVNNAWSDGMVLYSYDDGETWERKVFFKHPGPFTDFTDLWYFYPRWTSAQWDSQMNLHLAYEFMATTGEPGSGSYYPSLGGVAYWDETMPYRGDGSNAPDPSLPGNLTPGEPFIMDSSYTYTDIYASWWLWSDASHEMWPEYMGYLTTLDENNQWEDPYNATEFNIEDRSLHGAYNSGICAFPVLCKVPYSNDLVAVWSAMDENHTDGAGNYYYKLFASYSADGGLTWSTMVHLTGLYDLEYDYSECVYPQAVVLGDQLIIAVQLDDETGTFVQGDETDGTNNLYQGFTFNLNEIFPDAGVSVPEIGHNTNMTIYPNPATDRLNVTLNQAAEIVIYNIMGQVVASKDGKAGENTIELSNLSNGVYFVNAGTNTQKFIVK